jgi:hypothetical protein
VEVMWEVEEISVMENGNSEVFSLEFWHQCDTYWPISSGMFVGYK